MGQPQDSIASLLDLVAIYRPELKGFVHELLSQAYPTDLAEIEAAEARAREAFAVRRAASRTANQEDSGSNEARRRLQNSLERLLADEGWQHPSELVDLGADDLVELLALCDELRHTDVDPERVERTRDRLLRATRIKAAARRRRARRARH